MSSAHTANPVERASNVILGIDHVGIAVHDVAGATGDFADLLAHTPTQIEEVDGQAVRVAFVPAAWVSERGARVELLSPADPANPSGAIARFLERRGEGLHHVCFLTDDIEGEIARLSPRYTMVDETPRRGHGGRVAFLHPRGAHGVLVELIERDELPAPDPPTEAQATATGEGVGARSADAEGNHAVRLLDAARRGDRRALARALTTVETGGAAGRAVVAGASLVEPGPTIVVGITGAPGSGKSTLVSALAQQWRASEPQSTIAILAIDPSSPVSGGAVLGDRVRMGPLAGDSGVFVRSVAGRGSGDGLSDAADDMIAILRAVGFGVVFLETVGSGQDALAVDALVDIVVVVHAPGLGDSIQGLKAGLVDVADVLVVNKADLDGATALASALRFGRGEDPTCPVLEVSSTTGEGIAGLREAIVEASNRPRDPFARARRAIGRAALAVVRTRVDAGLDEPGTGSELVRRVASAQMTPTEAAYVILEGTAPHGTGLRGKVPTSDPSNADGVEGRQA